MTYSPKLKALINQVNSGKIKTTKAKILDVIIRHKRVTIENIIFWTNIKESTVVARLSDLEDLGIIEKSGTTKPGNHSYWIHVSEEKKQIENQKKVQIRKFLQWKSRGLKLYRNLMTDILIKELDHPNF